MPTRVVLIDPATGLPYVAGDVTITELTLDPTNLATGAKQDTGNTSLATIATALGGREYEKVAASQTAQVLGGTGATGDVLKGLLVVPTTVSPGVVTVLDNAISISVFAGGTNSLLDLKPFFIEIDLASVSGAWKVTTGAGLSVVATGNFSA
jgi:hypothetical protein